MGTDITVIGERYDDKAGKWVNVETNGALEERNYGAFGFMADVRNYSAIPPICERRGVPSDSTVNIYESHGHSWLSMKELLEFDYDQAVEDRRVTRQTPYGLDGGCTAEPGGGRMTTYREFLGPHFFIGLKNLQAAGVERIVFCFDC